MPTQVRLYIRVCLRDGKHPFVEPVKAGNGKNKPFYALANGRPEPPSRGCFPLWYSYCLGCDDAVINQGAGVESRASRGRSVQEKRQIVNPALAPGASVALVARAHGLNANQMSKRRRAFERGEWIDSSAALTTWLPVTVAAPTEAEIREPACRSTHCLAAMFFAERLEERAAIPMPNPRFERRPVLPALLHGQVAGHAEMRRNVLPSTGA
jgi:transposase-like protein